jgi:hypothetical protein
MVHASEVAFITVILASDKAWAVSGELVAVFGGAGRTVHYYAAPTALRMRRFPPGSAYAP